MQKPLHLLLLGLMLLPPVISFHFYWTEAGNVPYADQWCDAVPMVIAASDGKMAPWRPFAQHNVHRIVTASTFTLVNRYLTGWNLKHEILLNFVLAGINLGVLLWALRRYEGLRGAWLLLAGIFVGAMLFTIRARAIWMWSYASPYIVLFTLALVGALILVRYRPGPGPLAAVLALNVVALWSIGSGVISLMLVPVGLWLVGYRRWWHYLAWVGTVAVGFWVFFYQFNTTDPNFCRGYQSIVSVRPGESDLLMERLLALPLHLTRGLGAALLAGRDSDAAYLTPLGVWLMALLLLNGGYMVWTWWQHRDGRSAFVWMNLLGPALGGIALIGIGRAGPQDLYAYFGSNYVYQGAVALAGVAGLVVAASHRITRKARVARWERGLVRLNAVSVALFVLTYYHALAGSTDLDEFPHGVIPTLHPSYEAELCLRNFYFTDGPNQSPPPCYWQLTLFGDIIATEQEFLDGTQRLAELRLTTFASIVHRLPERYTAGESVVVASEWATQQYPVVTASGRRVPETDITRIVQDERQVAPLQRQQAVNVQVGGSLPQREPFWYFTPANAMPPNHSVMLHNPHSGVQPDPFRQPYDLLPLAVGPALRPADERPSAIAFGDTLQLFDWELLSDARQPACGVVDLELWWGLLGMTIPDTRHNLRLSVVAPDDPARVLFEYERALDPIRQTSGWQPLALYYEQLPLEIPCDAQAGAYALYVSVYDDAAPSNPLPTNTAPDDGAALLTTLTVQAASPTSE